MTLILLLAGAAQDNITAGEVLMAILQWLVSPLLVASGTWFVVRLTSVNAERGVQQTALTQEKITESQRLERYAEFQADRVTQLEKDLQTERRERMTDRDVLQSVRDDLRDERRINAAAVDYILGIVEDIQGSPDCNITIRPAPFELRSRLHP